MRIAFSSRWAILILATSLETADVEFKTDTLLQDYEKPNPQSLSQPCDRAFLLYKEMRRQKAEVQISV